MGFGGGLIGGIIGAFFGGPWGALIGAGIGATVSGVGPKTSARNADAENQYQSQEELVLAAECKLFECLGRLAKSDGRISEDEASLVSEVLKSIDQTKPGRIKLKAAFDAGKNSSEPFAGLVGELAGFYPGRDVRKTFLELFCSLAIADRDLCAVERSMLLDAERIFQLRGVVRNYFAGYDFDGTGRQESRQNQSRQNQSRENDAGGNRSRNVSGDSLAEAYATLGCTEKATDTELKKAWHAKVLEFHPDKVQGKGLNAAFVEFAKQEMQKINRAYETICRARGIEVK